MRNRLACCVMVAGLVLAGASNAAADPWWKSNKHGDKRHDDRDCDDRRDYYDYRRPSKYHDYYAVPRLPVYGYGYRPNYNHPVSDHYYRSPFASPWGEYRPSSRYIGPGGPVNNPYYYWPWR